MSLNIEGGPSTPEPMNVSTKTLPQLVPSLPSPAPSVAFPDVSFSPTRKLNELVAIPHLQLPVPGIELATTFSPPESQYAEDSSPDAVEEEQATIDILNTSMVEPWPSTIALDSVDHSSVQRRHKSSAKTDIKKESQHGGRKRQLREEDGSLSPVGNVKEAEPPIKRARVVGLKNLGNTCYNNAVIQALSHTTPLREYFLERQPPPPPQDSPGEVSSGQEDAAIQVRIHTARPRTRRAAQLEDQIITPSEVNLCNEFSTLLRQMWSDENTVRSSDSSLRRTNRQRLASVVSPHSFAGAVAAVLPLFQERYEQQDAQEFLRCALQRMQEELMAERIENENVSGDIIRQDEDTIVKGVFGGILFNKIVCMACEDYTIKPDPFLDLSLVIPDLPSPAKSTPKSAKSVSLEECIDLFSSVEELERSPSPPASVTSSGSGSGRCCLRCGSDSGFSKAFNFGQLPQILCMHLKRFRWRRNSLRGGKQKVDTHVRFPLEKLDMGRWMGSMPDESNEGVFYDLYAVVVHQGSGVNSGHYVAYVKHEEEWWSLNDDRAVKVTAEVVSRAKAYLLFYRKTDVPPTDSPISPVSC